MQTLDLRIPVPVAPPARPAPRRIVPAPPRPTTVRPPAAAVASDPAGLDDVLPLLDVVYVAGPPVAFVLGPWLLLGLLLAAPFAVALVLTLILVLVAAVVGAVGMAVVATVGAVRGGRHA